jgi:hypothetical protein
MILYMNPKIIAVSYIAEVQKWEGRGGRFSVPLSAADALGVAYDGEVALVVREVSEEAHGDILFIGTLRMDSKCEVYGQPVKHLRPGARILVEVSRPPGT